MQTRTLALLLCGALLALAGCNTTADRIRQKSEVFASLPAADQERLRKGMVAVGDTPDMVYIAIGEPTRRIEKTTAQGSRSEWIYRDYYESYEGSHMAGYRRVVGFDRRTGRRFVYLEPTYAEVYREHSEERLRVVFENGRVTAIEELQAR
ncbi:MAG TPA: hypothetical protein VK178_04840 [Opitutaceae bacterium]|nr:hypothetical protein [Opitutaceae bacterium]